MHNVLKKFVLGTFVSMMGTTIRACGGRVAQAVGSHPWGCWFALLWFASIVLTGASATPSGTNHPSKHPTHAEVVTLQLRVDPLPLTKLPARRLLGLRREAVDAAPAFFSTETKTDEKRALFWALTSFFSITPFFCACYGLCTLLCCCRRRRRLQALRQQEEALGAAAVAGQPAPACLLESVYLSDLESTVGVVSCGPRLNDECPICLRDFVEDDKVRQLPVCRHSFHPECISQWVSKHNTCPLCRTQLRPLPPESRAGIETQPTLEGARDARNMSLGAFVASF